MIIWRSDGSRTIPCQNPGCGARCLLNGSKEKQLPEGFLIGIDKCSKMGVRKRKLFKVHPGENDMPQYGG